jgi:pimeloyl-ACP methyl ester carboxylesterase
MNWSAAVRVLSAVGLGLAAKHWLESLRVEPPKNAFQIRADRRQLYVVDEGPRDARTVVLLHGSAGSCWSFEPLVPYLKDRYRVVVPERPGQGWSGRPRSYRLADMSETVYHALRLLGVERPILVGVSYGGGVAMRMAADHPEFASGLILLASDGPGLTVEGHSQETAMRLARTLLTLPLVGPLLAWTVVPPLLRLFFEQGLRDKFGPDFGRLPAEYFPRAKAIYSRPGIIMAAAREWSHEEADLAELGPALPFITVPTLVVRAELDTFVSPRVAEDTVAAIPGSRLVELAGAPHGFPESRPHEAARLIEQFAPEV